MMQTVASMIQLNRVMLARWQGQGQVPPSESLTTSATEATTTPSMSSTSSSSLPFRVDRCMHSWRCDRSDQSYQCTTCNEVIPSRLTPGASEMQQTYLFWRLSRSSHPCPTCHQTVRSESSAVVFFCPSNQRMVTVSLSELGSLSLAEQGSVEKICVRIVFDDADASRVQRELPGYLQRQLSADCPGW